MGSFIHGKSVMMTETTDHWPRCEVREAESPTKPWRLSTGDLLNGRTGRGQLKEETVVLTSTATSAPAAMEFPTHGPPDDVTA